MPIALERGGEIGRSGFGRSVGYSPICKMPEVLPAPAAAVVMEEEKEEVTACTSSSSSSSSIGKNSESCGSGVEDLAGENEEEVESAYKGGALNALESLEEALPMRRGISNFYNGKSKSFASLSHAMTSCASAKDLSKQANAYSRKRANLLASKIYHKSSSNLLKSNGGGISKKTTSSSRTTTLALAVAMSNSSSNSQEEQEQQQHLLPPRHPSGKNLAVGYPAVRSSSPQFCSFPMRSFSLTDLQVMGGSGSSIGLKKEYSRFY